jgi:membrane associated rhomboid family serine protease
VFAAIGALAVMQWRRRARLADRPFRRWTPLVVGVILLGYLGFSEGRTDVLAHVAGFLAGALLGTAPLPRPGAAPAGRAAQVLMGLVSAALLGLAWCAGFAAA